MKFSDADRVHALLKADFDAHPAPVVDLMGAQGASPFQILLATILSARTKDSCTAKVTREKLFPAVRCWDDIRKLSVDELAHLIHPVGFFRQKAAAIKKIPDVLDAEFGGEIPRTVDELMRLPGVGRKTANLVAAVAFGEPAVCVDVHVHRIMNRTGLLASETPLDTELALRAKLPVTLWRGWNAVFVSLGQRICLPRNPRCAQCPIRRYCDRTGV